MKRIISILIGFVFLISCNTPRNRTNELRVFKYEDTVQAIPSPNTKRPLPDGMKYGKIIPPSFPDSMKIENNLLKQVATYNSAILHGDVNTCADYLYPDALIYFRQYYPGYSDDEILKEFFKSLSGDMQNALKIWNERGIDIQIIPSNFERKIQVGEDVIIVLNFLSNICSEDVFIHTTNEDETIAISHNGGKNWWFMSNHEDSPTILKKRYNQEVVNAVMDY